MIPLDKLQPGDWLGYHHHDVIAEAIHIRTGGITHSAVYHGDGKVITSLGGGVNIYPIDSTGLAIVRRPVAIFPIESADKQFEENMRGLPYGVWDCLKDAFPDLSDSSEGMNCSHTSAQYYVYGGLFLFASDYDLKTITPRDFQIVSDSLLKTVYTDPQYLV